MEEDLFPLAKSIQSRNKLEEERRLFYVALTRAEKQAYLTYAERRYRFGNLSDTEPSRFIEEIDERYLHYFTPTLSNPNYRYKPLIDRDIFGEVDKNKWTVSEAPAPLRPRQLQAYMRAGATAAEVAISTGMDVEHVRRFEEAEPPAEAHGPSGPSGRGTRHAPRNACSR